MNSKFAGMVLTNSSTQHTMCRAVSLNNEQDKNALWNKFDYRHLVSCSRPIINFKGEPLLELPRRYDQRIIAGIFKWALKKKSPSRPSLEKRLDKYIKYWLLFFFYQLNSKSVRRSRNQNRSRSHGVKFQRLLMCSAAASGAGNIKQS